MSLDQDLNTLDEYSSIAGNQSEMLQFLNLGFRERISSVAMAEKLFANIFERLIHDDLLPTNSSIALTFVFLGSGRAALELFVALKILATHQEFYGVMHENVHVILCDYNYKENQKLSKELANLITAKNIKLTFVDDMKFIPRFVDANASRKNTFFFAFNFNLALPKVAIEFVEELERFPALSSCWIYSATSVPRRAETRGKRLYIEVTKLKLFFETYYTDTTERKFIEARCNWCKSSDTKLQHCGGCLDALYCDIKCQARDWGKNHQEKCNFKK